jgi:hypothetical protein
VLLGVTGSGKTFTMAKVIEKIGRPALILAHNKTLAAQLYHEFRSFFPENAVEYFVSYYDYYQPEAYIPSSDVYIEKEATINDELDKLRLSATKSLFERRDCVIVASVSCIYGLGSPEAYYGMLLMLEKGQRIARSEITSRLVDILYERNDVDFRRGTFRVRGDVIEVYPTYDDYAYRIELWGDEIESLSQIDPLLGQVRQTYVRLPIYPKTHYVMSDETKVSAMQSIRNELEWWNGELEKQGKAIEAQRLWQRTMFDLEMIKEIGYCHGIENYSRHFSGRLPGEAPSHPARLPAARRRPVHRREPPDHSATARHVPRRPLPEGDPGGARLPDALCAGQPAPYLRGVRAPRQPGRLRFGDARALRADQIRGRGGGADHPAHRPAGPGGGGAAGARARWITSWARSASGSKRTSVCWSPP